MKTLTFFGGVTAALALSVHASVLLGFDDAPSGTPANVLAPPALRFEPAVLDYDYDAAGDPIPGTLRWRADASAPAVVAENPELYGRGQAPSPDNALNASWQPVLVLFPQSFDLTTFSVTLDHDPFGLNGTLPGFSDVAIQFLDANGAVLASIPVDQTQPGFRAEAGPVADVDSILLPAGAFYDDLRLAPIPETGLWPLAAGLGALLWGGWRRARG